MACIPCCEMVVVDEPGHEPDGMSPEQIDVVVSSWRLAISDPELLHGALAARLPGSSRCRADRAGWIVQAVSRLSLVLDHPTRFVAAAADVIGRRRPVSMDELAIDRDALLGALHQLQGPLEPERERAWTLAVGLFGEIVESICLDPFGCGPPHLIAGPPARWRHAGGDASRTSRPSGGLQP